MVADLIQNETVTTIGQKKNTDKHSEDSGLESGKNTDKHSDSSWLDSEHSCLFLSYYVRF